MTSTGRVAGLLLIVLALLDASESRVSDWHCRKKGEKCAAEKGPGNSCTFTKPVSGVLTSNTYSVVDTEKAVLNDLPAGTVGAVGCHGDGVGRLWTSNIGTNEITGKLESLKLTAVGKLEVAATSIKAAAPDVASDIKEAFSADGASGCKSLDGLLAYISNKVTPAEVIDAITTALKNRK